MMTMTYLRPGGPILSLEQSALLWTMRSWVLSRVTGSAEIDAAEAATPIRELGAGSAFEHVDDFMLALIFGASRRLRVDCICVPEASDDECALLDVFARHEENEPAVAHSLLLTMVGEPAARLACKSSRRVALAFCEAGLSLATVPRRISRSRPLSAAGRNSYLN